MLVLALACGSAQAQKKDRDPVVRGKTVAAWVKELKGKDAANRIQAMMARQPSLGGCHAYVATRAPGG